MAGLMRTTVMLAATVSLLTAMPLALRASGPETTTATETASISEPVGGDLQLKLVPPPGYTPLKKPAESAGTALAYQSQDGLTFNLMVRKAPGAADGKPLSDTQLDLIGALLRRAQAKSGAGYHAVGGGRRQVAGTAAPYVVGSFKARGHMRKVCQIAVPDSARSRMLLFTVTGEPKAFDRGLPAFWNMLDGLRLLP